MSTNAIRKVLAHRPPSFDGPTRLTRQDLKDELHVFMQHSLEPALERMHKQISEQMQQRQNTRRETRRISMSRQVSDGLTHATSSISIGRLDSVFNDRDERADDRLKDDRVQDLFRDVAGDVLIPSCSAHDLLLEQQTMRLLGNGVDDHKSNSRELSFVAKQQLATELGFRNWVSTLVAMPNFDLFFAALILINAIFIGVETDLQALALTDGVFVQDNLHWALMLLHFIDTLFCIAFTTELLLRLTAHGYYFFRGPMAYWNFFDLTVCTTQILEQVASFSDTIRLPINTSTFRILRMLRMARISRMVRLLEMFRNVLSSIVSSLSSLIGTVLLLMLILYAVSVFITQVVIDVEGQTPNSEELQYWFGRLGRTYMTMFESIFGGCSWDEAASALVSDISPWLGVFYCCFVAFCTLSILNMATGVFVDQAMRRQQEVHDASLAKHIGDLFFNDPELAGAAEITYEQFCAKIDTPDMQQYFRDICVDTSEAKDLYKLLDEDKSGSVDNEEIVNGLMRLRGTAKALELQLLLHETVRMYEKSCSFQTWVEDKLCMICDALAVDLDAGELESEGRAGGKDS